jgi:hypothetical protein
LKRDRISALGLKLQLTGQFARLVLLALSLLREGLWVEAVCVALAAIERVRVLTVTGLVDRHLGILRLIDPASRAGMLDYLKMAQLTQMCNFAYLAFDLPS